MKKDMKKKTGLILGGFLLLSLVFVVGIVMAVTAEQGVGASVTVNEFVSITLTDAGSPGVNFGSSDPGVNNNPDAAQDTAQVTPAIGVTNDAISNVNVNIDVKGTVFNGSPSGTMAVSQATYDDDGTADENPEVIGPLDETVLATTYPGTPYYSAVTPGDSVGFWFFLDIPTGQAAASDYQGTFTFQSNSV